MARSRVVLPLVVGLLIISAGCMGGILGGGSGPTDGGASGDGDANASVTPTRTPANQERADAIREEALAAMAAVDTYRVEGRVTQAYRGDTNQTALINSTTVVDRGNRTLRSNQTQTAGGRSYDISSYLVNGTLYSNSDFYATEYGSQWLSRGLTDPNRSFDRFDVLSRQRAVLAAANVSYYGERTLNGTRTHLVGASVPSEVYERLAGQQFNTSAVTDVTVESARLRYYLDVETHRPVLVNGSIELTVETTRGLSASQDEGRRTATVSVAANLSLSYSDYGIPVNVTLPDGASDATSVEETEAGPLVRAP